VLKRVSTTFRANRSFWYSFCASAYAVMQLDPTDHLNNRSPVLGNLGQVQRLGQVDQVEDVLLETGTTESLPVSTPSPHDPCLTHNRCLQELGANSRVLADGVSDLVNGGTGSLADGRQSVDRRDTLGEHGVGGELGELRGPQADSKDSVLRDPVGIDVGEGLARGDTRLALERTDEDSVRGEQVVDGGTLGKELCLSAAGGEEQCISSPGLERMSKVHPGFELASRIVRIALTRQQQKRESGSRGSLGGSAWHSRLLDDDLGRGGDLGDSSRSELEVAARQLAPSIASWSSLQVGGVASSDTALLGRGVDRDEDEAARQYDRLTKHGCTHSASAMALSTSVEKNRFRPRACLTTSSSPGS